MAFHRAGGPAHLPGVVPPSPDEVVELPCPVPPFVPFRPEAPLPDVPLGEASLPPAPVPDELDDPLPAAFVLGTSVGELPAGAPVDAPLPAPGDDDDEGWPAFPGAEPSDEAPLVEVEPPEPAPAPVLLPPPVPSGRESVLFWESPLQLQAAVKPSAAPRMRRGSAEGEDRMGAS